MNAIAMMVLILVVVLWSWLSARTASTRGVRVAIVLFGGFHAGVLLSGLVRGEAGGMGPLLLASMVFAGVLVPISLLVLAVWRGLASVFRGIRRRRATPARGA